MSSSIMKKKSFAKVNIFLKIAGKRDNYHLLESRFMLVKSLYDEVEFIKKSKNSNSFELVGNFSCDLEKNSIYKGYLELLKYTNSIKLKEFFEVNLVKVDKNIKEFAGLGGGSSNCATFLNMCNDILKLNLSKDTLASIGAKIGADVPFFVYEYNSANVTGIGEIVEPYSEQILDLEVFTPSIDCDTSKVYKEFRDYFYKESSNNNLLDMDSLDILSKFDSIYLNDLYQPAISLYPDLAQYRDDYFFSGSGSSCFRIKKDINVD